MGSSRKSRQKRFGSRAAVTCILMIMTVFSLATNAATAAGASKTVAGIALYQGADRQRMLIEGAKKEGEFVYYTSNSWMTNVISKEFEKKYPFLKVLVARCGGKEVVKRTLEEFIAKRNKADVVESSSENTGALYRQGIFQEHYTPEAAYYLDGAMVKGKKGIYLLADRELYYCLGFNTEAISPDEAPKSYEDMLNPKWKGKMSIVGSSTGIRWIGTLMHAKGKEYIEKLSRQEIKVQQMTSAALATLIVSGEVLMSPTAGRTNITLSRQKGAPVAWRAFTPTLTTIGMSGITAMSPHPHAAMLFLDYLHSQEGQRVIMKGNLCSPRTDIGSVEQNFEKLYLESLYSPDEYEKRFNEWENILRELFVRKRS